MQAWYVLFTSESGQLADNLWDIRSDTTVPCQIVTLSYALVLVPTFMWRYPFSQSRGTGRGFHSFALTNTTSCVEVL